MYGKQRKALLFGCVVVAFESMLLPLVGVNLAFVKPVNAQC